MSFKQIIEEAYKGRNRDVVEAGGMLMIEASELAELMAKKRWYNKDYTQEDVLSEAGDVLNFLTFILDEHSLTLEEAVKNNEHKLRTRGWIK